MAVTVIKKQVPPIKLYKFGITNEGNATMKDVLGGKGANLAEMGSIGIRVPDGFTIPCHHSVEYSTNIYPEVKEELLSNVVEASCEALEWLVDIYGYMPLVSVRSGARVSMPGMMDTILNVGLTDENIGWWKDKVGERSALDSYRRLIQMYSSVALDVPMEDFVEALEALKKEEGVTSDSNLTAGALDRLQQTYLGIVAKHGKVFPQTLKEQIRGAIRAVFNSWNNPRAIEYRKMYNIPSDWGTAVNIQSMVFGNLNDNSATGVLFSRNPSNGENVVTGEFLVNAQGEDVVAGIRTPDPISEMSKWNPNLFTSLMANVEILEKHYKDMQDIEFTVQDGQLFILQTRTGKRSALSAFKVAYDMATEGLITKETAIGRVNQEQLMAILNDVVDPSYKEPPVLKGIAAGGGLVTGVAVFTAEEAVQSLEKCILITKETNPDDIAGMNASVGILTATGGLTSHAAVVARGMDKTCVVGATDLYVDASVGEAKVNKNTLPKGYKVTIDGSTGNVWFGEVPVIEGGLTKEASTILSWATKGSTKIDADPNAVDMGLAGVTAKDLTITTGLIRNSDVTKIDSTTKQMGTLGSAIYLHLLAKSKEIVVDLKSAEEDFSPSDNTHSFMFGIQVGDIINESKSAKVSSILDNWPKALKAKGVFINAGVYGTDLLESNGWVVNKEVMSLEDMYNSSGKISVPDDVITKVFGSKLLFAKVISWMEADKGIKFSSVGASEYWFQVLEKVA